MKSLLVTLPEIPPLAASKARVLVLMAGGAVPGDELISQQVYRGQPGRRRTGRAARESLDFERAILTIIKSEPDIAAQRAKLAPLVERVDADQNMTAIEAAFARPVRSRSTSRSNRRSRRRFSN